MTQKIYSVAREDTNAFIGVFKNRQDAEMLLKEEQEFAVKMHWSINYFIAELDDEEINCKTLSKTEINGKYIYSCNGKIFRTSKRNYNYFLMYKPLKSKGAIRDSLFRPVALGNNPKSMISTYQSIYHSGELKTIKL